VQPRRIGSNDVFRPPAELERLLAPLGKLGMPVMDQLTAKRYLEAQGAQDIAPPVAVPSATHGVPLYTKTGFLHSSSTAFNDEIVRRFEALPPELDAVVLVAQMGGAVSLLSQDATAFWTRKATHDLMPGGGWADRSKDHGYIKQLRDVWNGVERFTEGFYVNTEPGADDKRVRATYGDNFARRQQLKNKYDPGNLFPHERQHQASLIDSLLPQGHHAYILRALLSPRGHAANAASGEVGAETVSSKTTRE
jgi:hypothetical protein